MLFAGDNVGAIVVSVVHATTEQHNYELKKMPKRFIFSVISFRITGRKFGRVFIVSGTRDWRFYGAGELNFLKCQNDDLTENANIFLDSFTCLFCSLNWRFFYEHTGLSFTIMS